jgi:hypothetical protein
MQGVGFCSYIFEQFLLVCSDGSEFLLEVAVDLLFFFLHFFFLFIGDFLYLVLQNEGYFIKSHGKVLAFVVN